MFELRLLASFLVGGAFNGCVMWASERFGSRVGGILVGVPTTTFTSLLFISLTSGSSAAHAAAIVIPPALAADFVFAYAFTRLVHLRRELALVIALALWLALALLPALLHLASFAISCGIYLIGLALALILMHNYPRNTKGHTQASRWTHLFRILLSGCVVASAVALAHFAGPLFGGVFAAFPALIASALYLLSRSQGPSFAKAMACQIPLGLCSTAAFVALFYLAHSTPKCATSWHWQHLPFLA